MSGHAYSAQIGAGRHRSCRSPGTPTAPGGGGRDATSLGVDAGGDLGAPDVDELVELCLELLQTFGGEVFGLVLHRRSSWCGAGPLRRHVPGLPANGRSGASRNDDSTRCACWTAAGPPRMVSIQTSV